MTYINPALQNVRKSLAMGTLYPLLPAGVFIYAANSVIIIIIMHENYYRGI